MVGVSGALPFEVHNEIYLAMCSNLFPSLGVRFEIIAITFRNLGKGKGERVSKN